MLAGLGVRLAQSPHARSGPVALFIFQLCSESTSSDIAEVKDFCPRLTAIWAEGRSISLISSMTKIAASSRLAKFFCCADEAASTPGGLPCQ